ncbi:MAG: hypothetical protein IJD59_10455 [Clostridia bacterium]|nr:hypothetical protein [Clostridia bacterium]
MAKLRTNRSAFMYWLAVGVTLTLWHAIGSRALANDINTIMTRYDGKTTKPESIFMFGSKYSVFSPLTMNRINVELERRGIDFKIGNSFIGCFQIFKALNLLSEDYNRKGC